MRTAVVARRVAALLAIACAMTGGYAHAADKLILGSNWTPQAEYCGFYQARDTGIYAAHGLDVTLQSGGPEVNNGLLLAAGAVDVALGDSLAVLNMRASKLPVVAVAAFFQKDPQTLVAHPDPALHSLADLKGRPMMISNAQRNGFWKWAKAKFGFTDDQLRPYAFTGAPFLADPRAVQQGYITNDGFVLGKPLGAEPKIFLLADAGYENYADLFIAQRSLVEQRPDVLHRFVAASIEGWQKCLAGDFAAARHAVTTENPRYSTALFDYSMDQVIRRKLVTGNDGGAIGRMTEARWKGFYDTAHGLGILPASLDYHSAYTLAFVGGGG